MKDSNSSKSTRDMMNIAYQTIDFKEEVNDWTFKRFKPYFPEISQEMNFPEIMKIVVQKPDLAKLARQKADSIN